MKISGFTIVRNAVQYDFPIVECILSIIDLVDEFIVVLGDSADGTEQLMENISSDKIKIIRTDWDTKKYNRGMQILANQTDVALRACTGDWCFYVQADEVLHEAGIPIIKQACEKYLNDKKVDGFLLNYIWFYGAYDKYIDELHFAYPKEIRIVRNCPEIHSWRDAQSFRKIPDFDYENYWQKENTQKLNCIDLNAWLYHYSYSRDPRILAGKTKELELLYHGTTNDEAETYFNYGNLSLLPDFKGTHPAVMKERIANMNWQHLLTYTGERPKKLSKIFEPKHRMLSFLENKILGEKMLFGFKNYHRIGAFGWTKSKPKRATLYESGTNE